MVEFPMLPKPRLKLVENKLVDDAVVVKRLVEVAEVVVARIPIRSVMPLRMARLFKVVVPSSAVSNLA